MWWVCLSFGLLFCLFGFYYFVCFGLYCLSLLLIVFRLGFGFILGWFVMLWRFGCLVLFVMLLGFVWLVYIWCFVWFCCRFVVGSALLLCWLLVCVCIVRWLFCLCSLFNALFVLFGMLVCLCFINACWWRSVCWFVVDVF